MITIKNKYKNEEYKIYLYNNDESAPNFLLPGFGSGSAF
mgnify:CR=1 FL=1